MLKNNSIYYSLPAHKKICDVCGNDLTQVFIWESEGLELINEICLDCEDKKYE